MRRFGIATVLVVAVLAVTGYIAKRVLIDTATVPPRSLRQLELGELRRLTHSISGPLPLRINSEVVAEATLPSFVIVAGSGFGPRTVVATAFQVVYARGSVIIDTAPDRELVEGLLPDARFFPERFAAVQEGMRSARTILVTHEHPDHIGGISQALPPEEVLPKVVLTAEQVANREQLERAGISDRDLARVQVIAYEDTHVIAPGIVLVKAPGHTPGSQLVYVLLEGGREFLFVGDVAWDMDNVTRLVGRPRIVTWLLEEDREAVLEQVRMLHDFMRRHDDVLVVVSHDAGQLRSLVRSRAIGGAFE